MAPCVDGGASRTDIAGNAFPRAARLLTERDFKQVFAGAQRSGDACLTVLARDNGVRQARLGLAIARRRVRRAVDRNRIKRLARESFRYHRQLLEGLDVVVMARDGAGARSNAELRTALHAHWQRLSRRCRRSSAPSSGSTATC